MATLRGGTTIGGFQAHHSGLKHAYFGGKVTVQGDLIIGKAQNIISQYNNDAIVTEHNNGNISFNAAGGDIYLGYINTGTIRLRSNLSSSGGTTVADTAGKLYYQGKNTDTRYLRKDNDSYLYLDTAGNSTYGRITMGNNPSSSSTFIRTSGSNGGIIPYSNGTSSIGTTSWRFKEMHAVDFYENGTKLSSKYASSSHSHSNYVTKNGDRMTGALEIRGATNDASRISVYSTATNPRNGGSIELLESGPKYGATNSNGFRIRYDGYDNQLTVDSSYNSETRHLSIKRNGSITVSSRTDFSSSTHFNSTAYINSSLTDGYTTLNGSRITFGPGDKGRIGDNSSGWVYFGNSGSGSTYLRIYDNGGIAQFTGSLDVMGNVVASGSVRGRLSHESNYGYIYPYSSSAYGQDKSYLRFYYAGSGSNTNTGNRNELRIHTQGNNAVNTRIVLDGETVPRISYGTGSPPSTSNFRNGDLYIKY